MSASSSASTKMLTVSGLEDVGGKRHRTRDSNRLVGRRGPLSGEAGDVTFPFGDVSTAHRACLVCSVLLGKHFFKDILSVALSLPSCCCVRLQELLHLETGFVARRRLSDFLVCFLAAKVADLAWLAAGSATIATASAWARRFITSKGSKVMADVVVGGWIDRTQRLMFLWCDLIDGDIRWRRTRKYQCICLGVWCEWLAARSSRTHLLLGNTARKHHPELCRMLGHYKATFCMVFFSSYFHAVFVDDPGKNTT